MQQDGGRIGAIFATERPDLKMYTSDLHQYIEPTATQWAILCWAQAYGQFTFETSANIQ